VATAAAGLVECPVYGGKPAKSRRGAHGSLAEMGSDL